MHVYGSFERMLQLKTIFVCHTPFLVSTLGWAPLELLKRTTSQCMKPLQRQGKGTVYAGAKYSNDFHERLLNGLLDFAEDFKESKTVG